MSERQTLLEESHDLQIVRALESLLCSSRERNLPPWMEDEELVHSNSEDLDTQASQDEGFVSSASEARFFLDSNSDFGSSILLSNQVVIGVEKGRRYRYVGQTLDGKMHGMGTLTFKDGSFIASDQWCLGEPISGQMHQNDQIYQGSFQNLEPCGRGKIKLDLPRQSALFEGNFSEGKPDGAGKLVYADGSTQNCSIIRGEIFVLPDKRKMRPLH